MKAIKFIFAFSFLFMAFTSLTSCASDDIAEDEALYTQELFATGDEGTAKLDNTRE